MGLLEQIGDAVRTAEYMAALRNLIFFKHKTPHSFGSRHGRAIDEIVLHGTESLGTQEQSANSLAGTGNSIHYFIGRDFGVAYAIVPEDNQAFHAGNPKHHPTVQDHNPRSIGIELYQQDISVFNSPLLKSPFEQSGQRQWL